MRNTSAPFDDVSLQIAAAVLGQQAVMGRGSLTGEYRECTLPPGNPPGAPTAP